MRAAHRVLELPLFHVSWLTKNICVLPSVFLKLKLLAPLSKLRQRKPIFASSNVMNIKLNLSWWMRQSLALELGYERIAKSQRLFCRLHL